MKKQAPAAYDVLYDLPRKALDLSNAARIESESWETTRELVEAFEETQISQAEEAASSAPTEVSADMRESATEEPTLAAALGEYADCVRALAGGDKLPLSELSRKLGKPIDALVDAINEIAVDVIGDIIIDGCDGDLSVIEDYLEMLG